MNRRDMLRGLFTVPLAIVGAGAVAATPARRFGVLDVDAWRAHKAATGESLHVFIDGVDVTSQCDYADDVAGVSHVFCEDQRSHRDWTAKGGKHLRGGGVCRLEVFGNVVIKAGAQI